MNVDDKEILDRIERLAREAGALQPAKTEPKPEPLAKELVLGARYLATMVGNCKGIEDSTAYYTFEDSTTLTYGDCRRLGLWVERQPK